MIEVEIKVEVHPTEDADKILTVINNFAELDKEKIQIEQVHDDYHIYSAKLHGRGALQAMFTGLRSQRIVESARKHLMGRRKDDGVSFMLHKQGLFVQRFHFCHSPEESPMGPVWIKIKSDDITRILEYLVPHTVKGKPQEVDYLPS